MERYSLENHPCFSTKNIGKYGRIHLPVAPHCNIQCGYCDRRFDCVNESRPGITSKILTPHDAVERVRLLLDKHPNITVIGIAGPGDPLANEQTFITLEMLKREFPDILLCLSTNGLMLTERLPDIVRCQVKTITITVNAYTIQTASRIYKWVYFRGKVHRGEDVASILLSQQWRGICNAIDAGLIVKVNTVFCPTVNDREIPLIAQECARLGVDVMNIIPLIPQADFSNLPPVSREMLNAMRTECAGYINQMSHCKQCRADACGGLNQDIDMELEMLYDRIQEDYCDRV
ncbi:MAG: radical SAM protein [Thermodesulfovibrionales bacterium]